MPYSVTRLEDFVICRWPRRGIRRQRGWVSHSTCSCRAAWWATCATALSWSSTACAPATCPSSASRIGALLCSPLLAMLAVCCEIWCSVVFPRNAAHGMAQTNKILAMSMCADNLRGLSSPAVSVFAALHISIWSDSKLYTVLGGHCMSSVEHDTYQLKWPLALAKSYCFRAG